MKTYAYVTTDTCRSVCAVKPGSLIGRNEIPVSKHGDYTAWPYGKRDTGKIITSHHSAYSAWKRNAAREVSALFGWHRMGEL